MDDHISARDYAEEMLFGKVGVAERRRKAELEHELDLAKVRAQSKALVWTGTAEQLTAIVRGWYEAGLIRVDNLQDALEKASAHFVTPKEPASSPHHFQNLSRSR